MKPSPVINRLESSVVYRIGRWVSSWRQRAFRRQLSGWGLSEIRAIGTYTKEDELMALYELACGCPMNSTAVEIGSYLGASACYIAAGLVRRNSKLICVDTWHNEAMPDEPHDTFDDFQKNVAQVRESIVPLRKQTRDLAPGDLPSPLAFAFIDGDHSYAGARCDADAVTPLIAEGGILAFHDAPYFIGVSKVIGELLLTGNWQLKGQVKSLVWLCKQGFEK